MDVEASILDKTISILEAVTIFVGMEASLIIFKTRELLA